MNLYIVQIHIMHEFTYNVLPPTYLPTHHQLLHSRLSKLATASHPAGCRLLLPMLPTAVSGGGMRAFEAWSYIWWWRRRSEPLYSFLRL
jgi:hypothetical protein